MPREPAEMRAAIIGNLPARTGRALEEWVELVRSQGPQGRRERIAWLKSEHRLGHGQAQLVVAEAEQEPGYTPPTSDQLLEGQYSAGKAQLRPIYDRVAEVVREVAPQAALEPRKTYVTLSRSLRQFGVVQPTTRTRVDLGLRLPGVQPQGRLEEAGSVGSAQITHRIALATPGDVDDEVRRWLVAAYEQAG
jgi:hypothetical protein